MTTAVETSIARVPITVGPELALAAQAWPAVEREGQLSALEELLQAGKADELVLVVARRESRLVGAGLAQVLPGRAAVVWPPQLTPGEPGSTAVAVLQHVHENLGMAGVLLAQSLLETTASEPAQLLQSVGYVAAGQLLYMVAGLNRVSDEASAHGLELESYSPQNHLRFAAVVEATYRSSLDCPLVDGIRSTADVLLGYQSVGVVRSDLWYLVRDGGQDIGCILLADHPAQEQWEIVYLGIVPAARGRGWGRRLTDFATQTARQAGRKRLVLAVDAANRPAVEIYRAAGFEAWDRRQLWISDLSQPQCK